MKGPCGGSYLHLAPFSGPISFPCIPDQLPTTSTCLLSLRAFSSCHNHSAFMRSRSCQHEISPQPVPPCGINSGVWSTVLSSPMGWNSSYNIKPLWFLFFFLHYGDFMIWVTPSKKFTGFELGFVLYVNTGEVVYLGQFKKCYKRFLLHKFHNITLPQDS